MLTKIGGLVTAAVLAASGMVPAPADEPWPDADGNPIKAHGGSVVTVSEAEVDLDITGDGTKDQDVFLWYGEDKTHSTRPVDGVRGYWSTDLTTWHDLGRVLPTHQQFTLTVEDGQVQVDQAKVDAVKAVANKTAPDAESTAEEIDAAKEFVAPYVETWADADAGIAATYDEENLANASYRLNGNINIVERPKMLWNAKTGKFVIIYHADGPDPRGAELRRWVTEGGDPADRNIGSRYSLAEIGFATSDTPWGPFKLVNTTKMNWADGVPQAGREGDSRDMTVFQDAGSHTVDPDADDAYAVYSSEMNKWMYVSRLNAEYTGPAADGNEGVLGEDFSNRVLPDFFREASSVFKHDGWYYMLTSGTDGWSSTPVVAYRSRSMITPTEAVVGNNNGHPANGQWERLEPVNPCVGDPARTGVGTADPVECFDSQPTFVIDLGDGQFVYMGDRWIVDRATGSAGEDSRYVWAPIQVDSEAGRVTVENVGAWDPANSTLFHRLEPVTPLEFEAHVDDRSTFDPTFDVIVDGTRYDDLTADWSRTSLDAAFSTAGTHDLVGHVAGDGPLAGRYVTATVEVDGPVNLCLEAGTTVSASFHQTQDATFPPQNACDGNYSTPWSTWVSGSGKRDQVTFTAAFADQQRVDSVRFTNTEGVITGVGVEYRDGDGAWQPVTSQTGAIAANGDLTAISFDPVVTSSVRLTFDHPASWLKISEIVIPSASVEVEDPVNLCLEAGTTVSASFHQTQDATFPPQNACDGNYSTPWSTWVSGSGKRDQVTFTAAFADQHPIDTVQFTNTEGVITAVGVEHRGTDGAWHPVTSQTGTIAAHGELSTFSFDLVDADAVRLTFDHPGSWLKISEIVVPSRAAADGPVVTADATPRCVGHRAMLAVRAHNESEASVDLTLATAFGSKDVTGVEPGASAYQSFATRQAAVPAGSVTVTATAPTGATAQVTSEHAGLDCS